MITARWCHPGLHAMALGKHWLLPRRRGGGRIGPDRRRRHPHPRPTAYAVLRVTSGTGSANLALSHSQLIQTQGYISRPPTTGECEALETSLDAMGIPRASYGRIRP
jgi:hypothetical protein